MSIADKNRILKIDESFQDAYQKARYNELDVPEMWSVLCDMRNAMREMTQVARKNIKDVEK